MALRVKKMGELEEVNTFLRGGHVGGKDLRKNNYYLDGKTLVFTAPAGTVTFNAGGPQEPLTLRQIMDQINAVHPGMARSGQEGRLFLETNPPVAIQVANTSTALDLLGFDKNGLVGVLWNAAGTPPSLESIAVDSLNGGTYVMVLDEA